VALLQESLSVAHRSGAIPGIRDWIRHRTSAMAVFMLKFSSICASCSTGRSAGLTPFSLFTAVYRHLLDKRWTSKPAYRLIH
jgi:hypothetical protein